MFRVAAFDIFMHPYIRSFIIAQILMISLINCSGDSTPDSRPILLPREEKIIVTHRYAQSIRGKIGNTFILVLRGSDEEIGKAHGALAGKEIIAFLDKALIPFVNQNNANAWENNLLQIAKTFTFPAPYEKEITNIIKGIKETLPNNSDRMLHSLGREISVDDLRTFNCISDMFDWIGGECSSFAVWGSLTKDGEIICGRNVDYRRIPGKIPIIVIAREPLDEKRQPTIEIGGPGYIGLTTAINQSGMFASMNFENGLPPKNTSTAIPRSIVVRDALEKLTRQSTLDQVVGFYKARNVRKGNNTLIALPTQGSTMRPFVIEWDGNELEGGATVRMPDPKLINDAIVCTNHFIKRTFRNGIHHRWSQARYDRLCEKVNLLQSKKERINLNEAINMMNSVALSGNTYTYLSAIVFPDLKKMIFAGTPGEGKPATAGTWNEIRWDAVFELK